MAASCGPQQAFCPTGNPDPTDLTCHSNNDAVSTGGTSGGGLCDGAAEHVCTVGDASVHQCTPCGSP
ncbi:MAG TPA: hypothetical protein VIF57_03830 [Polyangia bacterium]